MLPPQQETEMWKRVLDDLKVLKDDLTTLKSDIGILRPGALCMTKNSAALQSAWGAEWQGF